MTKADIHATLTAARALQTELAERVAEMEDVRRLPADLATKMAKAGLFRMITPKAYGGLECTPREIVDAVEALSEANASAGWCAMIGATTAMNAAYMDPDMARQVYNHPETITGGVFAPSLFVGAMIGATMGGLVHLIFPSLVQSPFGAFVVVGMCSFFAGVAHAPIAAIIMVCEMTGGYALLAPLMLVSVLAITMSQKWSIYEKQVKNKFHSKIMD